MASITIRDLDDRTKERLRVRAARVQRSMEEEARQILREAVASEDVPDEDLATRLQRRFAALGGVDIEPPTREPIRQPPKLDR